MSLWVADLWISPATEQKIVQTHSITPAEIRDLVVCRPALVCTWHHHPERGTRAMIQTYHRGRPILIVLYPVAGHPMGDTYHLGSAYFTD